MKTLSTPGSREARHAHNGIAALLSIIPRLGHIYKGHYEAGLLWMFLGMPFTIWIGIILSLATDKTPAAIPSTLIRASTTAPRG
jgi:hypothetical protein